jgi:hypothetical protein
LLFQNFSFGTASIDYFFGSGVYFPQSVGFAEFITPVPAVLIACRGCYIQQLERRLFCLVI